MAEDINQTGGGEDLRKVIKKKVLVKRPVSVSSAAPQTALATAGGLPKVTEESMWYLDNFILLKDYYDRTISRISARCVRLGGLSLEQYPHFGYVLDLLDEICTSGDYVLDHPELHPYAEKKIKGGLVQLRKDLKDFRVDLEANATPDMLQEDDDMDAVVKKLGALAKEGDGSEDGVDDLMNRLMQESGVNMREYDKAGEKSAAKAPPPPPSQAKKRPFGSPQPAPPPAPAAKIAKRPPAPPSPSTTGVPPRHPAPPPKKEG